MERNGGANNRRSGVRVLPIILGVLLLVMGAVILVTDKGPDEDAPDFNFLAIDEVADTPFVTGNVELVLDCFAESYTTYYNTRTSEDSDELYYLVPAAPTDSEGYYRCTYLICMEAQPEDFAVMDQIMEETWAEDFTGEYTLFEIGPSKVEPISDELADLLDEYMAETGLIEWMQDTAFFDTADEAEVRARILPYVVRIGQGTTVGVAVGSGLLAVGLVLLVVSVIGAVRRAKRETAAAGTPFGDAQAYSGAPSGETSTYFGTGQGASARTPDAPAGQVFCAACGAAFEPGPDGRCPFCGSEQSR